MRSATLDDFDFDTLYPSPARRSGSRSHQDLVDLLHSMQQFSRFLTVVETAGFETDFREAGNFTVFAPCNAAFDKTDCLVRACATTQDARDFVDTYVIAERRSEELFLDRKTWARNLGGTRVFIDGKKGLRFGNAPVRRADIMARNGVIHELGALVRDVHKHVVPTAVKNPDRQVSALQAA